MPDLHRGLATAHENGAEIIITLGIVTLTAAAAAGEPTLATHAAVTSGVAAVVIGTGEKLLG